MIQLAKNPTKVLSDADNLTDIEGQRMATVMARHIPGYNQFENTEEKHIKVLSIDKAGDVEWLDTYEDAAQEAIDRANAAIDLAEASVSAANNAVDLADAAVSGAEKALDDANDAIDTAASAAASVANKVEKATIAIPFSEDIAVSAGRYVIYNNEAYVCTKNHAPGAFTTTDFAKLSNGFGTELWRLGVSMAPDFDPNNSYKPGDAVIYNGRLRIFHKPHTAGNAWAGATETTDVPIANFLFRSIDLLDSGISALSQVTDEGVYYANESWYAGNLPDSPDSGRFVMYVSRNGGNGNRTDGTGRVMQLYITTSGKMWNRNVNLNTGNASDWVLVNETLPIDLSTNNITSLQDVTEFGEYYCTNDYVGNIVDQPIETSNVGFTLFVTKGTNTSTRNYNLQIVIYTGSGAMFVRGSTDDGSYAQSWKQISNLTSSTKYAACGDSLTRGVWHDKDDPTIVGKTDYGYPYWVKTLKYYASVTNFGVGSSGWVCHPSQSPSHEDTYNAKEKVDTIDFSNYDLVTFAWGTNDYSVGYGLGNVNSQPGDDTVAGNMKYCIEKVLSDNPAVCLVVIGPVNRKVSGSSSSTNYALGYTNTAGYTMQQLIDMEKSICKIYGIQFIDQTQGGVVNIMNLEEVLPDGTHPYEAYYEVIGKNLAARINFE